MELKVNEWKEFRLGDIFDVKKAKNYTIEDIEDNLVGDIPYITRTALNNGVTSFVNNKNNVFKLEKGNCLIIGGESAIAFYQPLDFITGNNISKLYLKNKKLTQNIAFFILTVINQENYKYSYGRAFNVKNINNSTIKLPSTKNNTPDWDYMEEYIKTLLERERERVLHMLNDI